MLRISPLYILLLFVSCAFSASAQSTKMLSSEKAPDTGLVYSLPMTGIEIDLTAKFSHSVPGPYREYTSRYLGEFDVVKSEARSATVTDATMRTYGVAGPEQYVMTVKPGAVASICVAADGMLLSINEEVTLPQEEPLPILQKPQEPQLDEYLQYVDEDFLVSTSPAKKAQMLARTIMDIRESRLSLTRGTAETMPVDGRQLELMLASLQQQEQALMRAFTGYTVSWDEMRRVRIVPDSALLEKGRTVIARVAPGENFRTADDLVGQPVYITFGNIEPPEIPLGPKGEPRVLPKDAVVYRLPSTVDVSVKYGQQTLASQTIEMAQQSALFGLDPKLFTDKKAPQQAVFYPATGALESINAKQ